MKKSASSIKSKCPRCDQSRVQKCPCVSFSHLSVLQSKWVLGTSVQAKCELPKNKATELLEGRWDRKERG